MPKKNTREVYLGIQVQSLKPVLYSRALSWHRWTDKCCPKRARKPWMTGHPQVKKSWQQKDIFPQYEMSVHRRIGIYLCQMFWLTRSPQALFQGKTKHEPTGGRVRYRGYVVSFDQQPYWYPHHRRNRQNWLWYISLEKLLWKKSEIRSHISIWIWSTSTFWWQTHHQNHQPARQPDPQGFSRH